MSSREQRERRTLFGHSGCMYPTRGESALPKVRALSDGGIRGYRGHTNTKGKRGEENHLGARRASHMVDREHARSEHDLLSDGTL